MEKLIKNMVFLYIAVIFLASCVQDNVSVSLMQDLGTYTEYNTELVGLSGLALTPDGTALYAVCQQKLQQNNFDFGPSDGTALYAVRYKGIVYKLGLTGQIEETLFSGDNDFEAITVNKSNGDIYLSDETAMTIYKLSQGTLNTVVKINIENGKVNKGLEGLTYCSGDNSLYIANQAAPTTIFKYDLTSGKIVKQYDITFAKYLSDLSYDDTDNTLWILDSKSFALYHCDMDCNLKKTYSVSFVPKAEALSVDSANNTIWIGCDQTSYLYKVNMK